MVIQKRSSKNVGCKIWVRIHSVYSYSILKLHCRLMIQCCAFWYKQNQTHPKVKKKEVKVTMTPRGFKFEPTQGAMSPHTFHLGWLLLDGVGFLCRFVLRHGQGWARAFFAWHKWDKTGISCTMIAMQSTHGANRCAKIWERMPTRPAIVSNQFQLRALLKTTFQQEGHGLNIKPAWNMYVLPFGYVCVFYAKIPHLQHGMFWPQAKEHPNIQEMNLSHVTLPRPSDAAAINFRSRLRHHPSKCTHESHGEMRREKARFVYYYTMCTKMYICNPHACVKVYDVIYCLKTCK